LQGDRPIRELKNKAQVERGGLAGISRGLLREAKDEPPGTLVSGRVPTKRRIERLIEEVELADLEGVVIAPGPNLAYYTGVRAQLLERPFMLFVERSGRVYLLAPRLEAGPFNGSGLDIAFFEWTDNQGPAPALKQLFGKLDLGRRWGCEGRVPFGFLDHLQSRGMRLKQADPILQGIRAVKEAFELESLRKAATVLVRSYLKIPDFLRTGMTEKGLSQEFTEYALANGADYVEMSMVQSGPRAADPHSDTSSKKIAKGESIVVDSVAFCDGYAADITRTFVIGKNPEIEKVYDSVLWAQEKAIEAAKEGVVVGKVDAAARGSLTRDGLGDAFFHRTGHGLGLEVHEAPYIVSSGREKLSSGMVFTVEPGAYLPGRLGVRIEDDLVATHNGPDIITRKLPKEFGWWR
jgi:Xaa-Pro aminopeptidase